MGMPTVSARKKRPKPRVTELLTASTSSWEMARCGAFFVTSYLEWIWGGGLGGEG